MFQSCYQDTLEENKSVTAGKTRAENAERIPIIRQPSLQPLLPASSTEIKNPNCNNIIYPMPDGSRWVTPSTDFDFGREVRKQLAEIDDSLKFGQEELDDYLKRKEQEDFEQEALEEIQRKCPHTQTKWGPGRVKGAWFVGNICQDCDLMLNPFPSKDSAVKDIPLLQGKDKARRQSLERLLNSKEEILPNED